MRNLVLSPSAYRNIKRDFGGDQLADAVGYLFGVPVYESRAFPHQWKCGTCDGTGEGSESTYCQRCKGAGAIRAVGMMGNAIITEPLPKMFQPRFPVGIAPLPPLCRGLA